jgi:hypothetical protein
MFLNNFGLQAVSSLLRLGKGGPQLKNNSGVIEAKNATDTGYVTVSGADPINAQDFVTKAYLQTKANVIISGQINGSSPPAVVNGANYMCTTTGGVYTAGNYYYGNSGSWIAIIPQDGITVSVTTTLSGGTLTFTGDTLYEYDGNSTTWVNVGATGLLSKVSKFESVDIAYNSAATVNLGNAIPTGSKIISFMINVTQVFNGTTPTITLGKTGNTTLLATAIESDLVSVGLNGGSCYYLTSGSEQMLVTYSASSSTAGACSVIIEYVAA